MRLLPLLALPLLLPLLALLLEPLYSLLVSPRRQAHCIQRAPGPTPRQPVGLRPLRRRARARGVPLGGRAVVL